MYCTEKIEIPRNFLIKPSIKADFVKIRNKVEVPFWAEISDPERMKRRLAAHTSCRRKGGCDGLVEQDTIRLLRECDAGTRMGISSIGDVMDSVQEKNLKQALEDCKREHEKLEKEIQTLLNRYEDDGKEPNPMAKGMSWIKTNVKLAMNESDATIADLMTDGCNMGVKSLSKYLNQYQAADETSKNLAKRLIRLEEQLAVELRRFL